MKKLTKIYYLFLVVILILLHSSVYASRYMEDLGRGVVAVNLSSNGVYIGWRMLGTEPDTVGYNVYRDSVKINTSPITDSTNYIDTNGGINNTYRVAAVIDGNEQELSSPAAVWSDFYHDIPLQRPAGGTTPDGVSYDYLPNDAGVGDLDGDGEYEIVLKWSPSNAKDNSHSGYTGNVYLDAYELDGTFMWRIDLGINIRAGAHYTQFMVYDLDSDGYAEVACKTAPGTTDGLGNDVILPGNNPDADYRNSAGYILEGPEYLTVFDGRTGQELATTNYIPPRGNISDWGDSYGNRVDRFLACVAYLDGEHPSLVMCRGYYTRTVLAAWDFSNNELSLRWVFDSEDPGNSEYAGQGNHNLSVADVDDDGFDEIVYGSCTIDDNGTGLYSTGLGHGDALHVSDMDPERAGLEVWQCHEGSASGATFRDAATGEIIWEHKNEGDVGRAMAANIDSDEIGYQLWSHAAGGTYLVDGTQMSTNSTRLNFGLWWTADLQRELLAAADGEGRNPIMDKWNSRSDSAYRLLSFYRIPTSYSTASNNYTKANPCLSGDILGDWREEVIYRSSDNTKLRLFTTTELTNHRIYTLMHDPQYRLAIAWQNVGYNQPPHPSFYIGAGMDTPPEPDIKLVSSDPNETAPPKPDPMMWQSPPYVSGQEAIAMEAKSAFDPSGSEYYFTCTYGGGNDSGWQSSPIYQDTGLAAGQTYTYTVKARDKSNNQNTTLASIPGSCIAENVSGMVYWNFEDGSAGEAFSHMPDGGSVDIINNVVMKGYDTTWGPSFSSNTFTGSGLCAYFNGSQDGYTVNETLNAWSPQTWTIEVSVNLLDTSGWETIIGRDGSSGGGPESDFYLQKNDENGAFRLNIYTAGGQRHILDADFSVVSNKWYRVAVTSDGQAIRMYCNKLDGNGYQVVGTLDISSYTAAENALAQGGFNWTFGRGWYDGNYTDRITGYLDNIRFSGEALEPSEFLGSSTQTELWLYGDFTGNHIVNLDDLSVFNKIWLRTGFAALSDFNLGNDEIIDYIELSEIADNWLVAK